MPAATKFTSLSEPIFNELLYTLLFNATAAQKRQLSGKFLRASLSEKAAKNFIKHATDDEKKQLMSALGMKFFWCFAKEDFKSDTLRDILKKYEEDKKPSALRDVLDYGLYVSSDVNFLRLLGFVSRTVHHHAYFKNMELAQVGFQIKRWKKRAFLPADLDMRNIDEGATEMAKMLLAGSITIDYIKGVLGISPVQMKVILYLYTCPHRHTSEEFLQEFFYGYLRPVEVRVSIRELHNEGYIDGEREGRNWRYVINAKGTKIVNEFFKTVFSKFNF